MLPPDILPLFPLPEQVLLPGIPLSFRVFEPRYLALVADLAALPEGGRWLVVPRLVDGWKTDYEGRPAIMPVAAAARLVRIERLENNESLIVVEGALRIRLEEIPSEKPYRLARWSAMPDDTPPGDLVMAAAQQVLSKIRIIARRLGDGAEQLLELAAGDDRVLAADRLAALLIGDVDVRQKYLETCDATRRLNEFAHHLTIQLGPGAGGAWDFSRN